MSADCVSQQPALLKAIYTAIKSAQCPYLSAFIAAISIGGSTLCDDAQCAAEPARVP